MKNLRCWLGKDSKLVTFSGAVIKGQVEMEEDPVWPQRCSHTENRYYFKTSKGEQIPITIRGKNRIAYEDGRLVQKRRGRYAGAQKLKASDSN